MRVCLYATLLFAAAVPAAPVPYPAPPSPPAGKAELTENGEAFVFNLHAAVDLVAGTYVRPVARAELLQAALGGLYEAARRPVPKDLRRRIDEAEKAAALAVAAEQALPTPAPLVPALAPGRRSVPDDRAMLDLIRTIRAEIGKAEGLEGEDPLRICCQAMLRSLDPYSGIISANEQRKTTGTQPERDGFGLEVHDGTAGRLLIKDVLPGGPAQRAGLRPGDEIAHVHDSDGRERKLAESLDLLNGRVPLVKPDSGSSGTPEPIRVTFRRPPPLSPPKLGGDKGGGERGATLDWRRFRPESVFGVTRRDDNSWNYWLDAGRKIAHLRLGNLLANTPDELYEIVADLRRDGLCGLILDLRWCPGGSLDGSRRSAEWFLGEGVIATVRYRNRPEDVYRSTDGDKLRDFPVVVLINGDTVGGGELIAAALQDHRRAVLVGQRTRGKGNVQTISPLGTLGLKVTSGTLVRPSGKNLHRFPDSKPADDWGVTPDAGREFRISPDLSRALQKWWERQTLRPGSSTERLPLDDPLIDPQRNRALEVLTELMNRSASAKEDKGGGSGQ